MLIYKYISESLENVISANRLADVAWDIVYSLSTFPSRYQLVKDNVRKVSVGKYNIYYSVDEAVKIVSILHILYQGRDITQIANW